MPATLLHTKQKRKFNFDQWCYELGTEKKRNHRSKSKSWRRKLYQRMHMLRTILFLYLHETKSNNRSQNEKCELYRLSLNHWSVTLWCKFADKRAITNVRWKKNHNATIARARWGEKVVSDKQHSSYCSKQKGGKLVAGNEDEEIRQKKKLDVGMRK